MRALLQRVSQASVTVEGKKVSSIGQGFLVLLGVTHTDTNQEVETLAQKIVKLRVFSDEQGKMNKTITDINGSVLVVSQFTLYADCKKGNRPGFSQAAPPELADKLYQEFIAVLQKHQIPTAQGIFGAHMEVNLLNDGPVTLILET